MLQQQLALNEEPLTQEAKGGKIDELIHVSDDDDEDDDDQDDDEDDEDDDDDQDDDDDDQDEDEDDEDDQDEDDDDDQDDVINSRLLNLSFSNNDLVSEEIEDLGQLTDNIIKTVHLETPIELTNESIINITDEGVTLNDNKEFLKNIIMTDLEETEESQKTTDFKKMSLNKLRDIVVSSGLVTDASKLKKNDILKLLSESS
jgi:hypothetical protein